MSQNSKIRKASKMMMKRQCQVTEWRDGKNLIKEMGKSIGLYLILGRCVILYLDCAIYMDNLKQSARQQLYE